MIDLLDTDEHSWVVDALKAAKAWGQPPLHVLVGRPAVWREEDSLLAMALEGYLATRVDHHGFPTRLSENPVHEDDWEIEAETVNFPDRLLAEWQKENKDLPAGVTPRIKYVPTIRPEHR